MDFVNLVALYLLLCLLALTCLFAGDWLHYGPLGFFRLTIYKIYLRCHSALPAPCIVFMNKCYINIFRTRNRVFQGLYILLVVVGHAVFVCDVLPYLYAVDEGTNHTFQPLVCLLLNTILFLICCTTDAGVVNASNLHTYTGAFLYDGLMYKEGNKCSTCEQSKPARSKHCAIYNKCIFKFDHYCAWTHNCVGGLNHRYFVLFLVSLVVMCSDGAKLGLDASVNIVRLTRLDSVHYLDQDGLPQPINFRVIVQTLFLQFPRLVFLVTFLSILASFLAVFTGYHLYLVLTNQTTNERYKRHYLRQQNSRNAMDKSHSQTVYTSHNRYNRGIVWNIMEEVAPLWTIRRKKTKLKKR